MASKPEIRKSGFKKTTKAGVRQDTKPTKKGAGSFATDGQSIGGEPVPTTPPAVEEPISAPAAGNPNFSTNSEVEDASEKTMYLKLDPSGNPLWHRMTPRTIEAWSTIFKHPATAQQFNTQPLPTETAGASDNDAKMLLGWLGAGQAMLFAKLTGLSIVAAGEICAYGAEETADLSPRLSRLLNKHGGEWMAKYGDEIFFASAFGMGMARRYFSCYQKARERAPIKAQDVVTGPEVAPSDDAKATEDSKRVQ